MEGEDFRYIVVSTSNYVFSPVNLLLLIIGFDCVSFCDLIESLIVYDVAPVIFFIVNIVWDRACRIS